MGMLNEVINGVMLKSPFDKDDRATGALSNNQVMQTYKGYNRIVTQFNDNEN